MPSSTEYRGRFAPSPTGPLHFGSLVAAVGSYLDAKHHHGTWLVRMEDLDTPRCVPGAADDILRTLEAFGLHSDEPVIYQSQRTAAYEEALHRLKDNGAVYPCCCTRKEISDSALYGIEGPVYPGTCRNAIPVGREGRAWRVRTNNEAIELTDALQSRITQHLESQIGDFVVKRADGLFAYQLAVVVDDAFQRVTHIVRGADLLASTPRQIHLQRLLGFSVLNYMHLPVAMNGAGEKLSKQTLAAPVDESQPVATLLRVLDFLRQEPPDELLNSDVGTVMGWAVQNWHAERLIGMQALPACE
ncbi:MAG: tRNA glutamyl-Q(34) synthetase GluQRS [Nitrosomonadales bacterium]|nr:tRNA glutamyl-Q(34) synthetase GluQRS [Nitrosomonadales bacterium]